LYCERTLYTIRHLRVASGVCPGRTRPVIQGVALELAHATRRVPRCGRRPSRARRRGGPLEGEIQGERLVRGVQCGHAHAGGRVRAGDRRASSAALIDHERLVARGSPATRDEGRRRAAQGIRSSNDTGRSLALTSRGQMRRLAN
jgi:hypothetical protein